jgi:chemotaxis protein methyltransferase CheR
MDDLLRRKQEHRDYSIRIWSAGCSTGQEPYTLAMQVADALSYYFLRNPMRFESPVPKPLVPAPWRVEILASDINYSVLRAAQEGSYGEQQMLGVDYGYRLRYFDKVGDRYAVKKNVKELVHFDFHNLKTEYLPQRNDIIFCRNVMMYFDEPEQKRLVEKFYRCLNPQGYLFVGHAESLLGLTEKFQMVHRNSGTAYQRVEVTV